MRVHCEMCGAQEKRGHPMEIGLTPDARLKVLCAQCRLGSAHLLSEAVANLFHVGEEIANDSKCDLVKSERRVRLYSALKKLGWKP